MGHRRHKTYPQCSYIIWSLTGEILFFLKYRDGCFRSAPPSLCCLASANGQLIVRWVLLPLVLLSWSWFPSQLPDNKGNFGECWEMLGQRSGYCRVFVAVSTMDLFLSKFNLDTGSVVREMKITNGRSAWFWGWRKIFAYTCLGECMRSMVPAAWASV